MNNSDRLIEKVPISLYPNEILEKSIIFSPLNKDGEIIVVIDEENKIKESDEDNNIATKLFSVKGRDSNLSATNAQIINTTPQEANISNYLRITMQIKDINASNSYIFYNQDINRTFTKLRMNSEGNGSYFIDIDPLGKENIEYYFEIDTGTKSIISPIYAPNELYRIEINYQNKNESKEDNSLIGIIRKIISNIF